MESWEGDQVHGYLIQVHIEGTFKPRGTGMWEGKGGVREERDGVGGGRGGRERGRRRKRKERGEGEGGEGGSGVRGERREVESMTFLV